MEKSNAILPAKCRIIDRFLHKVRENMAYAGKGTYKGAEWKVTPLGFRSWLRWGSWVFPYFIGERVEFVLKVEPTKDIHLKKTNERILI